MPRRSRPAATIRASSRLRVGATLAIVVAWVTAACGSDPMPRLDAAVADASVDAALRDAASDGRMPPNDGGTVDAGGDGGPDAAIGPDGGSTDCPALTALSMAELVVELRRRVDGHTVLSYNDARDSMYGISGDVDVVGGLIESIYTGETAAPDGTRTPGGSFNTEHTWPRAEGADSEPALSDMHHIFPCDEASNAARASLPYGDADCTLPAGCSFELGGSRAGDDGTGRAVFEVRPERRGDVARAHFYFSVRYRLPIDAAEEASLRAWHGDDPPDDAERGRNDRIEAYQANRNPFVDCPALVSALDDF